MAMLEPGEAQRRLGYHPATDATRPMYETSRSASILLFELWNQALPPGREAALALTALQEAMMWANAAVACNAGDDWQRPALDVSELVDDLLEHLEGPLHIRTGELEPSISAESDGSPGFGVIPAGIGPVEPVEGAERLLRGDCLEWSPFALGKRCELVAGHAEPHRRDGEVWS